MAKKSTLSKEFVKKMKTDLEVQKEKLSKELNNFTKKNTHVDDDFNTQFPEYGDKEDENAAEVADYINNLPIEEGLEKTLRDVKKSLARIADGTYGICKYCKVTIDEKRLLARPTSSACVDCKKTINREL